MNVREVLARRRWRRRGSAAEEVEHEAKVPVASERAEDEVTPEDHIGWQQFSEATDSPAASSFHGRAAAMHQTAHLELGLAVASSVLGRALDASPAGRILCVLSGANEAWTEVVAWSWAVEADRPSRKSYPSLSE